MSVPTPMIAYAIRIMPTAFNERLPMAYAVPIASMASNVQRPIAPMASAAAAVPMASDVSNEPAGAHPAPRAAPSQTITTEHVKLVHGDCVEGIGQLPASSVDLVIADPPYNIAVQGSAWDTVPDYLAWSAGWLKASIAALRPGGSLFLYGSPAKLWIDRLKLVAAELGLEYVQHISWVYKQGGDSRLTHMTSYSVRMEYLEWFVKPGGPPQSRQEGRIALGSAGPYVDADWWDIPRENSRSKERAYGPPHHPSMKPLRLCDRLVEGHSLRGQVVLVPFGGSGSECVSVVQAGRKLIAFETDKAYYELILRRMHGHGLLPSSFQPLTALGDGAAAADDDEQLLMRDGRYMSGYMGVFKHGQKWVAKVMRDGAFRSIGVFATPKEAARAYRDVCASEPDVERPGNRVEEARAAKRAAARTGEGLVRGDERRAERSELPVQAEATLNTALISTLISSRTVARSSEEVSALVGAPGVSSAPLFRAPLGPPMAPQSWPAVAERGVVAAAAAATSATSATSAAAAAAAAAAAEAAPDASDELVDTELGVALAEDLPVVTCSAESEDDDEDVVIASLPNIVPSISLDLPPSKRPCRRPAAAPAAAATAAAAAAAPAAAAASMAVALAVGHRVEARYKAQSLGASRTQWYPGKVTQCHPDGTVDVQYDDGDFEARVPPKFVVELAAAAPPKPTRAPPPPPQQQQQHQQPQPPQPSQPEEEGSAWRRDERRTSRQTAAGPNKEGPNKEGPDARRNERSAAADAREGAPARLGERAAAELAAVRTKPPPGWTKVMDFGKLKGYRSRDGRTAMSLPAAWRLYDEQQRGETVY